MPEPDYQPESIVLKTFLTFEFNKNEKQTKVNESYEYFFICKGLIII